LTGGVAMAVIPTSQLGGSPRVGGYATNGKYAVITASQLPPPAT